MILSNDGFDAFHYRSYGTFFLHKIGSIISIGDLPTTNIIEPIKEGEDSIVFSFINWVVRCIMKVRECEEKVHDCKSL